MKLLLDTQLILWLFGLPGKVPERVLKLVADRRNELYFSPISILEVAIKSQKRRADFEADCDELCIELAIHGVTELPVRSAHASAVRGLPLIHRDPFDRLLLAQAIVEDLLLLTTDSALILYPSNVMDAR